MQFISEFLNTMLCASSSSACFLPHCRDFTLTLNFRQQEVRNPEIFRNTINSSRQLNTRQLSTTFLATTIATGP